MVNNTLLKVTMCDNSAAIMVNNTLLKVTMCDNSAAM